MTPHAKSMMSLITARWSAMLAAGSIGLVLVVAGCGGSGNGSTPASGSSGAPAAGGSYQPAKPSTQSTDTGAIPQNNGGDQDADNNGGPSDGDGSV